MYALQTANCHALRSQLQWNAPDLSQGMLCSYALCITRVSARASTCSQVPPLWLSLSPVAFCRKIKALKFPSSLPRLAQVTFSSPCQCADANWRDTHLTFVVPLQNFKDRDVPFRQCSRLQLFTQPSIPCNSSVSWWPRCTLEERGIGVRFLATAEFYSSPQLLQRPFYSVFNIGTAPEGKTAGWWNIPFISN